MAGQSVDLVCEGGGVKGIGLAGAYSLLEERGYEPYRVAGTSAGAITSALIAAGLKADDLRDVVFGLDFKQFLDKGWEDRIPLAGYPLSLLTDQGLYEGNRFHDWMRDTLAEHGVHTFEQLKTDDPDERWKYRLQVIVSDITARQLLVLPRDSKRVLGIDPDDLEVALAVRASMSIPIFFEPVRIKSTVDDREHILVDGGMLSNFPVWLFDCDADATPRWPTFGLLLVEPEPTKSVATRLGPPLQAPRGMKGLVELLSAMVHTMMEFHDRLYVQQEHWARTIGIPTLGVGTTEFDLADERKEALFKSGRDAATDFLKSWNFEAYVEAYRKGRTVPRRRDVAAAPMQEVHA